MTILLIVLVAVLAGLCAGLGFALWTTRSELANLQAHVSTDLLPAMVEDGDSDAPLDIGDPQHPLLIVEVFNPLELAAQHHRFGSALSLVSPTLTRRIVFGKIVDIMTEQLEEQGVEAEIRLLNR